MWRFLFWPFTKSYELLRGGIAEGAAATAKAAAKQAGAKGAAVTAAGNAAKKVAEANVNKRAGQALVATTSGLAALGGIMGISAVVKTDETAQKVGDFIGGTATEGKNVLVGLIVLAGLTAIGVGAYIVIKRK